MRDLSGIGDFELIPTTPLQTNQVYQTERRQLLAVTGTNCHVLLQLLKKSKQVKFSCKKISPVTPTGSHASVTAVCSVLQLFQNGMLLRKPSELSQRVPQLTIRSTTDSQASSQSSSVLNGWTTSKTQKADKRIRQFLKSLKVPVRVQVTGAFAF